MDTAEIKDDFRQSVVIMKNEIMKFASGKKLQLFGALMVLVVLMVTVLVYVYGGDMTGDKSRVFMIYMGFTYLIIILGGVLFSATSIVSEFEERTALMLFTKPLKKWSIFIGKYLASSIITLAFVLFYYLVATIVTYTFAGKLPDAIDSSLGLSVLFTFAMTGMSFLFSSIAKKGSTASIMTLVMYLLVFNVLGALLQEYNIDTWWIITNASNAILNVFTGTADVARDAAVLLVWTVATAIPSYLLFSRRDF